jgi:hypothetical protein
MASPIAIVPVLRLASEDMKWFRRSKTRKRRTEVAKILDTTTGEMIGSRILITNHPKIPEYADLVYFTISYVPTPLPSKEDFNRFDAAQDCLDNLIYELEFCCVGIVTMRGKRDYILYAKDGQRLMPQLLEKCGEFAPQMESYPDPGWTEYRELLKMK